MFMIDGICYAGEPKTEIEVIGIKPLEGQKMFVTFSTGETRLFDAAVLEEPAFAPLKDTEVFNHAYIDHGVVTWLDGDIDCAPEYMYQKSYVYENIF